MITILLLSLLRLLYRSKMKARQKLADKQGQPPFVEEQLVAI